ncbi:MAG: GIY-YIG nuclease family protein [Ignavibacteria bacterium]|nr:GIY-YIG nuclease family protein [Ignavibacteria bacterium]
MTNCLLKRRGRLRNHSRANGCGTAQTTTLALLKENSGARSIVFAATQLVVHSGRINGVVCVDVIRNMAFSKEFERQLDKLFLQRTHWLRNEVGLKKVGKPPIFDRSKVDKAIERLQLIASNALSSKLAKKEFNHFVSKRKNYLIKGRGPEAKKELFEIWFSKHFPKSKGLVYAFWGKKGKCIYVGRTGSHGSRPSSHFEKYWFPAVRRAKVFSVDGKSQIPKLECLAIHHFQPSRNKNKASTGKWTKACPLCETHKHIRKELRSIFRLR